MLAHAGGADESLAVAFVFVGLWVGWAGWSRIRGTGFPRLPRGGGFALIAAAAALVAAAAIVPGAIFPPSEPAGETSGSGGPAERPSSTATLSIVAPTTGATITDDQLVVVVDLREGRIVETASSDLRPDEGQLHLTLDGEVVSMTYGTVQIVDLRTVPGGRHTLRAEFVAADHGPFSPRVTASVGFTTGGGR